MRDTRSLAQSQKKATDIVMSSGQMFSGRTATDRQVTKRKFSRDFVKRCTIEYDQAIRKYRGEKPINIFSFPWYVCVLLKSLGRKSTSHIKA